MRCLPALLVLAVGAEIAPARPAPERAQLPVADGPLLAFEFHKRRVPLRAGVNFPHGRSVLARVHPRTLRPVSPAMRVGGFVFGWDRSPDGRRGAFGMGTRGTIKFAELRSMRTLRTLRLPVRQPLESLRWVAPDRVLAVTVIGTATAWELDASSGRVRTRRPLGGRAVGIERFAGGFAVLLAPSGGPGPARLALVRRGSVRTVALPGIRAGFVRRERHDVPATAPPDLIPGLAVGGGSAWVVSAQGFRIARVDLRSGAVSGHEVVAARAAKGGPYSSRVAAWVGEGRLAVAGVDGGDRERPFGLRVVDTATWRARTVYPGATGVDLVAGALLHWRHRSGSLRAHEPGGRLRFVFRPREGISDVALAGDYAYVHDNRRSTHVIDVRSGRRRAVLHTAQLPVLLGH